MSLYLYAIFHVNDLKRIHRLAHRGIDGQDVQFHVLSPFAIAYSESKQERYLASRANLLAHEGAIEAIMKALGNERVPLPLQFGLVVEHWARVERDLITGHQEALLGLLAKLAGKREVGIKLFWDKNAELNLLLEENEPLKQSREALVGKILSMDEAVAIGKDLEAALESRQELIIDTFLQTLQPLAYEYEVGELLTENMLYNAAFLIDWDREPEFAAAIEHLDKQFDGRLRIRYNNFTAPFNFVKL